MAHRTMHGVGIEQRRRCRREGVPNVGISISYRTAVCVGSANAGKSFTPSTSHPKLPFLTRYPGFYVEPLHALPHTNSWCCFKSPNRRQKSHKVEQNKEKYDSSKFVSYIGNKECRRTKKQLQMRDSSCSSGYCDVRMGFGIRNLTLTIAAAVGMGVGAVVVAVVVVVVAAGSCCCCCCGGGGLFLFAFRGFKRILNGWDGN
jgi:hypothetical protein